MSIGQPSPVARPIEAAAVDAPQLRRLTEGSDPALDLLVVFADGMLLGSGEHDEEVVERPEALEVVAKGRNRPAARWQQTQHVGIKCDALQSDNRNGDQNSDAGENPETVFVRPDDDAFER